MPQKRTAIETITAARRKKKRQEKIEKRAEEMRQESAQVEPTKAVAPPLVTQPPGTGGTPIPGAVTKGGGGVITIDGKDFVVTPTQRDIIEGRVRPGRLVGVSGAQAALQQAATGTLEQAGAFEEVTPTRTELSTPGVEGDFPISSPIASAISNLISPKGFLDPLTDETIREKALRKVRFDEFKKGTSNQVKFGVFIETIPIAGKAVSSYVSGLIQTPSGNAENIFAEISAFGEEATNNQEKTRSGIMLASFAMARAKEMEEQIAELEGRLKYLVNISPILQAETDNVNKWETKIFQVKERIDNFRTAAAFALTADLTGTGRVVPTDEELYFALKEGT